MMDIIEVLLLWFITFSIKKSTGHCIKSMPNQLQVADELQKPIIRTTFLKKYIYHLETIFGVLILQIGN